MSYFSAAIESVMRERSLTQTELSRRAQVHQGQLSRYINAEARPDTDGLERLCHALGEDGQKLLIAFLKDEVPYSLRATVDIRLRTNPSAEAGLPPQPSGWDRLSRPHQQLIDELIAESECSPNLMRTLSAILALIQEG